MLQPDNALKTAFLNALTKPLDDASSLVSHGADKVSAARRDLLKWRRLVY